MKLLNLTLACISTILIFAQEKPNLLPQRIVFDEYHGQKVEDPYRYMEDLKNEEVLNWMKANNKYAEDMMATVPGRQGLKDLMLSLVAREGDYISNLKITNDGTYYYINQKVGEEFGKLYKRECYECDEVLVLDPKIYKQESDQEYAIQKYIPSHEGDLIAIEFAVNGSENPETKFIDNEGDFKAGYLDLARVYSWLPNDDGVIYTKLSSADVTTMDRKIDLNTYIHMLGTSSSEDKVILSRKNNPNLDIEPNEIPWAYYDADAKKFFGFASSVDNRLKTYLGMLKKDNSIDWEPITVHEDNIVSVSVGTDDIYMLSYKNAPNKRILKLPVDKMDMSSAVEVVPEKIDETIIQMKPTIDGIYYVTVKNGIEANGYFLPKNGKERKLAFPFTAGNANISIKNARSSEVWFTITGWTSPNKRYRYNPETNVFTYEPLEAPIEFPELENVIAKEVMVTSHDGEQVPVSIIYDKNLKMDGSNPAFIYGYGAYGNSQEPFFSPINLVLTSYGVVFVVPHVRGGGELGVDWHNAGKKLTKPNTWKDGIATAEYLIEQGYTSKGKIGIVGGSAGGIFVGRAITERPDLFQVAAPMVGCMNTVRGENSPNGPVNIPEFGTVEDPEEFTGLLEMDSYHHVEKGEDYPALWITAGMNDPRVIAWQPAKFAARIQAADQDEEPILFVTDFSGGHGRGASFSKMMDGLSSMFSFMLWQTDHPEFKPANRSDKTTRE
ncbi:prolyl oligopeptidase family serine peptidase [Winogradskyella alexanderae]|uniref:prolyl oligopeptidase n=1 Tax=Winogradskyella alexanderae TaxID=2877123 RepID=A0ABS7XTP1_9FLAO|nr:prolyl oligopeptidase family serine peptidase [Winogradskyella alexanderae]MCA0133397.1 prolyl oligopeptidase family serine peptidase [Winogradskyella alexanderae]